MSVTFLFGRNGLCGIAFQNFKLAFMGKSVFTYVADLETICDVTSGNDSKCDSVVTCNLSPL